MLAGGEKKVQGVMGLENIHTDYFGCPEVSHFVLLSCTSKSAHQTTKSLRLWITAYRHT